MSYGLTKDGFVIKRLPEIKSDIEAELRAAFGNDVDTQPSSVFGQLVGIISKKFSELWEQLENVYKSQSPASAEGVALDDACQYVGITRLPATHSTVTAVMFTDDISSLPISVPAGTRFSTNAGVRFDVDSDTDIDADHVLEATVTITESRAATYTVTLNGTAYSYNATGGETVDQIAQQLVEYIKESGLYTALVLGEGGFRIRPTDCETTFTLAVSGAYLEISEIGSPAECTAVEFGAKTAPAGTLINIDTPVSNLDRVNNLIDAGVGRETETDAELRLRRAASLQVASAGTLGAIRASILQNVKDVTVCKVYENATDVEVDGRPPHSIEVVVSTAGDAQEIGQKIWDTKPAGIATCSTAAPAQREDVEIVDTNGDVQHVLFSRATPKYVWVLVRYWKNAEETLPDDANAAIAASVADYGNANHSIGDDLIRDKLYGPIYCVKGLSSIPILRVAVTSDPSTPPGNWVETNIAVADNEYLSFDADRVNVAEA